MYPSCAYFYNPCVDLCSGSNPKGKNILAVSNSVTYNESHKTEGKIVPYWMTDTRELYAVSTEAVNEDAHNDPSLLYAYATVDTQRVR